MKKSAPIVASLTLAGLLLAGLFAIFWGPSISRGPERDQRPAASGPGTAGPALPAAAENPFAPRRGGKTARPALMPAIPFFDRDGAPVTFEDYSGKVVLVNFWATWCAPCVAEMPSLDRLESKLGGADFAVLPISQDREGVEKVATWYTRIGIARLPILIDRQGQLARELGLTGLPTSYLLDRQGQIVGKFLGSAEWDSPEMLAFFRTVIEDGPEGADPDLVPEATGPRQTRRPDPRAGAPGLS